MKVIVAISLLLLAPLPARPQQVAIELPDQNIGYAGLDNRLIVAAYQYPCKSLIVTTTLGSIKHTDEVCNYFLRSGKPGIATVEVKVKKGRDTLLLGSMPIRIDAIPDPVAMVAGKRGGSIPKNVMAAQLGPVAELLWIGICGWFEVVRFRITIIRDEKVIYCKHLEGTLFDEEVRGRFKAMQPGDTVIISGLAAKGPDEKIRQIAPIEFTIQ